MSKNSLQIITEEISKILFPLKNGFSDFQKTKSIINSLGWEVPEEVDDLGLTSISFENFIDSLQLVLKSTRAEKRNESLMTSRYINLFKAFFALIDDIKTAVENLSELPNVNEDYLDRTEITEQFFKRLFDYLIISYFKQFHYRAFTGLILIKVFELERKEANPEFFQTLHIRHTIHFDRIVKSVLDPSSILNKYHWSTSTFLYEELLVNLAQFLESMGGVTNIMLLPQKAEEQILRREVPEASDDPMKQVSISLLKGLAWDPLDVGIKIFGLRESSEEGTDRGIAITPFANGTEEFIFRLTSGLFFKVNTSIDLKGGVVLLFRPNSVEVRADLLSEGQGSIISNGKLLLTLQFGDENFEPFNILSIPGGSCLESQEWLMTFGVDVNKHGELDLSVETGLKGGKIILTANEGDGFLQKVLPKDPLVLNFDLVFGYSHQDGFFIKGGGGFELNYTLNKKIGPLIISTIHLGLYLDEDSLALHASSSIGVSLGPVQAAIKKLGLKTAIDFNKPGLLGNADLTFGFLPPTGVGLSVAADGVLIGGGFLDFDHENERYSGVLALQFLEFGVTAIGLITTKMPDGSKGFSMLIEIGITFEPPFQLAFGFTLNGVGGLVGINRTMRVDVLQAGLKTGALDSILFPDPKTVVAKANEIISNLRAVFPPEEGQYVVGPMVKIGWGSNLLIADVGVFIEFSDHIDRINLLGQVEVMVPSRDDALVSIHLDILGSVDFNKEELTFRASLYDSYILIYQLAGDAAMLLRWGYNPEFALSIGGFHPSFQAPDHIIFQDMRRLSMTIGNGDNFSLTNESYYAITSNSFQFGARSEHYVHAGPLEINGFLGYDALFYFDPFSFIVSLEAGVSLSVWGWDLLEIYLALQLSGPTPWNAWGTAEFSILGIGYEKDFDITWGGEEKVLQEAVDPWPLLQASLENPDNWGTYLPNRQRMMVTLRDLEEELEQHSSLLLVHPLSTLELRQRVCPLNMRLEKIANSPVKDHDEFTINGITLDGNLISSKDYEEYFAPGQFLELTDDEKLSKDSFEKFTAGIRSTEYDTLSLLTDKEETIMAEREELGYESDLYNSDGTVEPQGIEVGVSWGSVQHVYESSAKERKVTRGDSLRRLSLSHQSFKVEIQDAGDKEKGIVESNSSATPVLRKKPAWRLQEETYRIVSARDFRELSQYQEETLTTRSLFREAAAGETVRLGRTAAEQQLNRHFKEKRARSEQPEEWLIVPEIMTLL